ncbi:hypothetical protein Scep_004238 [Stephania cephalantha]|uniref:Uncharacterized protein n=1 Tax=Stephania cephalantha TaxID=152367 RepID=A0AAP0KUX3_9MAGN
MHIHTKINGYESILSYIYKWDEIKHANHLHTITYERRSLQKGDLEKNIIRGGEILVDLKV